MTKHVCFGCYAMQRDTLPLLLYCSVLSRSYEKEEHQVSLNLGERWSKCTSKIWRCDCLASCFCNMGSRKSTSSREVSTQHMKHVLIIEAKVHPHIVSYRYVVHA